MRCLKILLLLMIIPCPVGAAGVGAEHDFEEMKFKFTPPQTGVVITCGFDVDW